MNFENTLSDQPAAQGDGVKPRDSMRRSRIWIFSLVTILIAVTGTVILDRTVQSRYEFQIVVQWTDDVVAALLENEEFLSVPCPAHISSKHQLRLLRDHFWSLDDQAQLAALLIIADQYPRQGHDVLVSIFRRAVDPRLQITAMRVIAIYRNVNDIDLWMPFLDSDDEDTRIAAIESIGIIQCPDLIRFRDEFHDNKRMPGLVTSNDDWGKLTARFKTLIPGMIVNQPEHDSVTQLDDNVRSRLAEMAISDPSMDVRFVAKTALSCWADTKRFRFAEWGVWINDGGDLSFLKSIIDEIPPFVHRTNDSVLELEKYRMGRRVTAVTKPIIHVTVDQPTVFSCKVLINQGRPWFAYPKPNDFHFKVVDSESKWLGDLDPPVTQPNQGVRPVNELSWLEPKRTDHAGSTTLEAGSVPNHLGSIGLSWEKVFVQPHRPQSWALKSIEDAKFKWWSDLRSVPCSWVNSQGESERFLYYDGPTKTDLPFSVRLIGETVKVFQLPVVLDGRRFKDYTAKRNWLYVSVSAGSAVGTSFSTNLAFGESKEFNVADLNLSGDGVYDEFVKLVMKEGLNQQEAIGMANCWKPAFFEKDGVRLLCFMNRYDYDSFCPIEIDPQPTKLARCGVVLTEFTPTNLRDDPLVVRSLQELETASRVVGTNGLTRTVQIEWQNDNNRRELELISNLDKFPGVKALELNFAELRGSSPQDLSFIGELKSVASLEELNLSTHWWGPRPVPFEQLVELKQIKKLTLENMPPVEDECLVALRQLSSLEELVLKGWMGVQTIRDIDTAKEKLRAALPKCKIVFPQEFYDSQGERIFHGF